MAIVNEHVVTRTNTQTWNNANNTWQQSITCYKPQLLSLPIRWRDQQRWPQHVTIQKLGTELVARSERPTQRVARLQLAGQSGEDVAAVTSPRGGRRAPLPILLHYYLYYSTISHLFFLWTFHFHSWNRALLRKSAHHSYTQCDLLS